MNKDLGRIVCHIPARAGSKRVKSKNLRLLNGKPMIEYAIKTAIDANLFDDIYVNTDSSEIEKLALSLGVKVYLRSEWLASDEAKGDDFTADFMKSVPSKTLLMISPVCPLITSAIVNEAINVYKNCECDTLITCERTQMQVFCNGKGVNIDDTKPLLPTQKNPFIDILNWAVTIWDTDIFLKSYEKNYSGYLGTNRILFPIPPHMSIKVSHEQDFILAEKNMRITELEDTDSSKLEPKYWKP